MPTKRKLTKQEKSYAAIAEISVLAGASPDLTTEEGLIVWAGFGLSEGSSKFEVTYDPDKGIAELTIISCDPDYKAATRSQYAALLGYSILIGFELETHERHLPEPEPESEPKKKAKKVAKKVLKLKPGGKK